MPIYKYVSAERIDILKNGYIRFTQPGAFNDPFEMNPYFVGVASEEAIGDFIKTESLSDENIERYLEEGWTAECQKHGVIIPFSFVRNLMKREADKFKPIMNDWIKQFMIMKRPDFRSFATNTILGGINKAFGILCLTEKPDNLVMWGHYSRKHSGFVIEFDEGHNFFNERKNGKQISGWLRKVRYAKKRPEIILFDASKSDEENLNQWVNDLIWVKSEHWEYEQEWRIIHGLRECKKMVINNEEIYLYPIPIECITGVISGCRISDTDRRALYSLLKSTETYSHIRILQAAIDEREYKLNFTNVA